MVGSFAAFSFRLLEPFLSPDRKTRRETTRALRAARIATFPEWYLAQSYFSALIAAFVGSLVTGLALYFLDPPQLNLLVRVLLAGAVAVVAFLAVRLAFLLRPRMRATSRAALIDREYQSVVVLAYALARGGLSTADVFRAVADEKETYGEISTEFSLVVRDIDVFGHDIITALQNASATTPSALLKGFLEGLVTILNSGADPRDYFRRQAEVQLQRAEVAMEGELEQAGMLAEVYVSSFLVLPLLLIVVLSGLSALGNGQEAYIPLVVYGLIPIGTIVYLLLLEVLMPPAVLAAPKIPEDRMKDFGVDAIPSDTPKLPPPWRMKLPGDKEMPLGLRWRLTVFNARDRTRAWLHDFKERLVTKPGDAIEISGTVALLVVAAGGFLLYTNEVSGRALVLQTTGLLLLGAVVAALPISIFHEIRITRARRVESALPEMLSKLSGFNERGIGLLQSFQILGRSASGNLADELRAVERDVSWNGHLQGAIKRLRDRVSTLRMTKLCVLLSRASAATGSMKEVLDIAASDETRTEALKTRKKQSMISYVIVIYLVFAVFLYVTFTVANLFYGDAAFAVAAGPSGESATALGSGLAADDARLLFFHAVVLQGVASGIVAGRLGEGHLLSGLKHGAILGCISWLVFTLGGIT